MGDVGYLDRTKTSISKSGTERKYVDAPSWYDVGRSSRATQNDARHCGRPVHEEEEKE